MRLINLLRKNWLVSLITLFCCIVSFYHGCSYVSNPSSYTLYPLSAESNSVYLTNFLKIEAAIKVDVEKNVFINRQGQLNIFRNNQVVNKSSGERLNNKIITKFELLPNDKICIDSFCETNKKQITLFSVYDEQDKSTIATSNFAFLKADYFPVNDVMGIMSDTTSSYILLNNHSNHIEYIDKLSKDTRYYINYEKSSYSIKKIIWLTLSTLLLGTFLLFVFLNYKKLYTALLKDNLTFATFLTLYIIFIYLAVFPAIFAVDTVLMVINEDSFTEWYSATYMAYSYLVYFLGQKFIILPTLIIFWTSTLYLVNSSKCLSKKVYTSICCYILILLFFVPHIFIIIYGIQRYFTAAIIFISGLQFVFSGFLQRSKNDSKNHKNVIILGVILIMLTCAMRIEYCIVTIIFIFSIARYFNLTTVKKSIFSGFSVCTIALLIEFIFSIIFSIIYDYDRNANKRDYRLITLVNLTAAYSECPASEKNYIDENLAPEMDQTEICNLNYSFENYFWEKISLLRAKQREELHHKIVSTLPEKIIESPQRMMIYLKARGRNIMFVDMWSIINKYKISHYDRHLSNADRFHMFNYEILGKTIYNKVMDYYYSLGRYNLIYQMISFILIFFVHPALFRKNAVCQLINLSVMALFCFIMLAAPSAGQWGYLVFIPIWCCYAPIFILFEQKIRRL